MPTCTNNGCNREPRMRSFKGSMKQYSEGKCKACQGTESRYGMSKPDWDLHKSEGGSSSPFGAPGLYKKGN